MKKRFFQGEENRTGGVIRREPPVRFQVKKDIYCLSEDGCSSIIREHNLRSKFIDLRTLRDIAFFLSKGDIFVLVKRNKDIVQYENSADIVDIKFSVKEHELQAMLKSELIQELKGDKDDASVV